ncbi:MAG: SLATT domain-containing protein [Magnetococcales bacterium]|nr:SLATT domain-containing protein [Magnetococcales bacterium]
MRSAFLKPQDIALEKISDEVFEGLKHEDTRPESYQKIWAYLHNSYAKCHVWYLEKRLPYRRKAILLRGIAIGGMAIAALWPALQVAGLTKIMAASLEIEELTVSQYGYLAAAIGSVSLAIEQFSGVSKAWIRYTKAAVALNSSWASLEHHWSDLQTESDSESKMKKTNELLANGSAELWRIVSEELEQWAKDYSNDLQQLNSSLNKVKK